MDADDISLPERLQKQVDFMDSHPDVGVCGTWMSPLQTGGRKNWFPYPAQHEAIKVHLLFYTALAHPTVIMRRAFLEKHNLRYEEEWKHAEDYALWARCAGLFALHNIQEILVQYRIHDGNISKEKAMEQAALAMAIAESQLKQMNLYPTAREASTHNRAFFGRKESGPGFAKDFSRWLLKLIVANHRSKYCHQGTFIRELIRIYLTVMASHLHGPGRYSSSCVS
jgi:hypothetical protein